MAGWQNSDRRDHLPGNWQALRKAVFRRDGHRCTAADPNTGLRCPEPAEECDHVGKRDDHRLSQLTSLCRWHHGKKTGAQGAKAAHIARAKANKRFRRVEEHPGLRS